jgi:RNA recognition motif-containing protein
MSPGGNFSEQKFHFEIFEQYGNLVQCKVVMDREDKTRSRGFAFIEFDDPSAAEEASRQANGIQVHDRSIRVRNFKDLF